MTFGLEGWWPRPRCLPTALIEQQSGGCPPGRCPGASAVLMSPRSRLAARPPLAQIKITPKGMKARRPILENGCFHERRLFIDCLVQVAGN